jgi:hypothetical protein
MTMTDSPATTPSTSARTDRPGKAAVIVGWVLSGLVGLFLLVDAGVKLAQIEMAVQGSVVLGFPAHTVFAMGVLLLVGVLLYLVPRTSVFGAVFTTAYLGGAVCAQVRVEAELFGYVLFPVYVAVLLWLGLYLRSAALRRLVRDGY